MDFDKYQPIRDKFFVCSSLDSSNKSLKPVVDTNSLPNNRKPRIWFGGYTGCQSVFSSRPLDPINPIMFPRSLDFSFMKPRWQRRSEVLMEDRYLRRLRRQLSLPRKLFQTRRCPSVRSSFFAQWAEIRLISRFCFRGFACLRSRRSNFALECPLIYCKVPEFFFQ